MQLRVTPIWTCLEGRISLGLYAAITAALQYTRQDYGWVRGRGRQWTSTVVPLWHQDGNSALTFPTGLLPRVRAFVPHVPLHQAPDRAPSPVTGWAQLADGTALYPDQIQATHIALAQRCGLLALATNFGKTEVLAAVLTAYPGRQALVVVHKRVLATQTAARLHTLLGEPVAVLGGGPRRTPQGARVTVATIQTLHLRRERPAMQAWLAGVEVLLADEVHAVSPTSWFPTLVACTGAWVRLGLSGTVREIKHPLVTEAFFGPVLHEVTDATLIHQGRSATTTVLMPWVGHAIPDGTAYERVYDQGVVQALPRNALLAAFAVTAARQAWPVVMYFYRLEHGALLERLCRAQYAGTVGRLDGGSSDPQIRRIAEQARTGHPGIYLLGVGFNEGIDWPGVRVLINAAGWRSPLATSQKGGRVLRRKPLGGNWAVIVDPYDLGNRTLKNHSRARATLYRHKGFEVLQGSPESLQERLGAFASDPAAMANDAGPWRTMANGA